MRIRMKTALAGCALWLGCSAPAPTVGTQASAVTVDQGHGRHDAKTTHVLLLSIDGFHDFDLTNYVASAPDLGARVAGRARHGLHAGLRDGSVGLVPGDAGDDDRRLAVVDRRLLRRDVGRQPVAAGLELLDARHGGHLQGEHQLHRDVCVGVGHQPGDAAARSRTTAARRSIRTQYLKVNTIYEVIHNAGMRTAATDKHPAYEMLNGPSGTGLDDFYGPEFNGAKKDIAKTMANDELKRDGRAQPDRRLRPHRHQLQRGRAGDPRHELPGREHRAEVLRLRRRRRHDAGHHEYFISSPTRQGARPAAGDGLRRRRDPADAGRARRQGPHELDGRRHGDQVRQLAGRSHDVHRDRSGHDVQAAHRRDARRRPDGAGHRRHDGAHLADRSQPRG